MDSGSTSAHHDTHAIPPQVICNAYKRYQRMEDADLDEDLEIVDFRRGLSDVQKEKIVPVGIVSSSTIAAAQQVFRGSDPNGQGANGLPANMPEACMVYEHKEFDGLRILPGLLPPECQVLLLSRLLHRDLSNPLHKTNIHSSHAMPYPRSSNTSPENHPESFFTLPQSTPSPALAFKPLNPSAKPLNTSQFLHKKLRWLTLGAQYDWTTRSYPPSPSEVLTPFPPDIASLVTSLFPIDPITQQKFVPESGVVLLYSTKDYMPVHRDVSELSQRGLASFSLGCDGIFVVGRDKYERGDDEEEDQEREMEIVALRVRSGDVVQMGGKTRWAWHAMPKVLAGTCPEWMEDWPAEKGARKEFARWKGYMNGKRLNISCRQVWG